MSRDIPQLTDAVCDRLADALRAAAYDTDTVIEALGHDAHAALGRGEPEPAARACAGGGPLAALIRLFLLGDAVDEGDAAEALRPLPVADAVAAGVLRADDGGRLRAGLDIRPHADDRGSWWVIADLDSEQSGMPATADHVLGVGHASMSLVRATTRRPVGTLLDLGTGNGVQALHASRHARSITATDSSERALALAAATFRLNGLDVELARGEWLAPVARRRFDQIVCNPPFVVGPPRVDYTYRDSGLAGDDASALLVRQLPSFLADGGVAQLLASWLHVDGEDWADRVAGWLPDPAGGGVADAWFVQRDVADPSLYVGTWLRDAGFDPRSPEGRAKSAEWLSWFERNHVQGIGFGFITLHRLVAGEPTVVCEDLRQAYDDPLGAEAGGWLDRVAWFREHSRPQDLLQGVFTVPPTVALERIERAGEEGWQTAVRRLHRADGPGWQHEVDELAASLLAGCQGALPLGDLLELLAAAHGQPTDELVTAALPVVRQLVLHGMLRPADLPGQGPGAGA